jgi:hypothetical protein
MFPYKCSHCGRFGEAESKRCPSCGASLGRGEILDGDKISCGSLIGWTYAGFMFLCATAFLAFELGGVGHGWMLPGRASLLVLVNHPLTGLAWALRRKRQGWWIALYLLISAIVWDVLWLVLENRHADDRFEKVWSLMPVWVVVWAVLYFGPQLFSLFILYLSDVHGDREASCSE